MSKFNINFHKTIEKSFTILHSLGENSNLKDGSEAVRLGLLAFWRFPNDNTRTIAELTGLSVPGISALRKELQKLGFFKNLKEYSEVGFEFIHSSLKFSDIKGLSLYYTQNSSSEVYSNLFTDEFSNELEFVLAKRPHPNPEFDQSRLNLETIVKRIKVLLAHGDLEGRRICLLGDDDGISISLSIFKQYNPQFKFSISVIDIDDFVIDYIKKFDQNKEIDLLTFDLREKNFPEKWLNKFDVILTDPPYTINGARLFLKKAHELLHHQIGKSERWAHFKPVYFSFSNKPTIFNFKLSQMILNEYFNIDTLYKRFNFYSGERLIYRYSNMMILKSLPKNTDKFNLETLDFDKIYTWQMLNGGKPRNKRIKKKN
jgi:predicted methyltransferase